MPTRDYRDVFGGGVLILFGVFVAVYALAYLRIGTVSQMGAGMFPAALGVLLTLLGAMILVPALFRTGNLPRADVRSLVAISASVLAFATMIRPFGLIPATFVLMFIASRADGKLSPIATLVLATSLSLAATLVFRTGLGMPVAAFAWPW